MRERLRENVDLLGCYILAHAVNGENAKAKFDNGLLNVQIPIKRILKGKKVPIAQSAFPFFSPTIRRFS